MSTPREEAVTPLPRPETTPPETTTYFITAGCVTRAEGRRPETDGENRVHDGDVAYDEIYEVAKVMRGRSMSRTMAGTVKEILGTCFSIGCTVDGQHPRDMQESIDDGSLEVADYEAPTSELPERLQKARA